MCAAGVDEDDAGVEIGVRGGEGRGAGRGGGTGGSPTLGASSLGIHLPMHALARASPHAVTAIHMPIAYCAVKGAFSTFESVCSGTAHRAQHTPTQTADRREEERRKRRGRGPTAAPCILPGGGSDTTTTRIAARHAHATPAMSRDRAARKSDASRCVSSAEAPDAPKLARRRADVDSESTARQEQMDVTRCGEGGREWANTALGCAKRGLDSRARHESAPPAPARALLLLLRRVLRRERAASRMDGGRREMSASVAPGGISRRRSSTGRLRTSSAEGRSREGGEEEGGGRRQRPLPTLASATFSPPASEMTAHV
jgi:hypothetical protein